MARIIEFVQDGYFLEGIADDVSRDVTALCYLMTGRAIDAALALSLFETASAAMSQRHAVQYEALGQAWEQDRVAERRREQELATLNPPPEGKAWHDPEYRAWEDEIREQARRDVLRAKWATELPEGYQSRLPMLHARSFVLALAQVSRALDVLARLDTGSAKGAIESARDSFAESLPALLPVRHSIEHAEDRVRSLDKSGRPLTLQPIDNPMISAPGGGALVSDSINGRSYGCTIEDGTYAEVEVSDNTLEVARAVVQSALDALPWRQTGARHWTPHA